MVVISLNFEYDIFIIDIFAKLALAFALSIQLIHLLRDGLLKYYNNQLLFFFTTSNEMGQQNLDSIDNTKRNVVRSYRIFTIIIQINYVTIVQTNSFCDYKLINLTHPFSCKLM